ncbi:C6 zinc finger domain-containing protein [Colletotrichum truncatum]|uniref:C6 zinc finger domain-containing protein n=1 Tax=Colletotrichum truncatum TaxID=5467 RepID=A0ACC3ZCB9_COLTU|nr:C6 zinc finger domain-containing protein [Colletotrichum truncatum]KAF6797674.1 C6 zinc finger domain-containing protein [Colletotrichum truncatum]
MEKRTRRLGHKKSRNGCLRCKARRVKCDENRPCHRCVAHGTHCSLLDPLPSATAPPTPPASYRSVGQHVPIQASLVMREPPPPPMTAAASDTSFTPTAVSTSPYSGDPELDSRPAADAAADPLDLSEDWLQSLRLMHHYSTVTSNTLKDSCTEELWKTAIPEMACSHKFLMHGLLAVAALHYAHVHPEERRKWDIISVHHQNTALRFFATRLNDIDKTNCEAYFFLASLIFIVSIYSVAHADTIGRPVGLGDVAQSFRFLHGVKGILDFQPLDEWRQRGGPLDMLLRIPQVAPGIKAGSVFQKRLDIVTNLAREVPATFHDVINEQTVCVLALESLRRSHQLVKTEGNTPGGVWGWSVTLPALFIDMIGNEHPTALVILAHFLALSRLCEHGDWASGGWSKGAMLMIDEVIDDKWRPWIEWPKKSVMEQIDVDDMDP